MMKLFILDEWKNFLERMQCEYSEVLKDESKKEELRNWASFRSQTLSRTGERKVLVMFISLAFILDQADAIFIRNMVSNFVSFVVTVRGMMYYREALRVQAFLEMAEEEG